MNHSKERILTTHTGSLPRPPNLVEKVAGHEQREIRKDPTFDGQVKQAVSDIVRKQVELGIDVVNDGEMSKRGFSVYITERLSGFDGPMRSRPPTIESGMFPEYYALVESAYVVPTCNGPITWCGDDFVESDIANLKAALGNATPTEAFMSSVSPGQVCHNFVNEYYPTHEAYLFAVADAMRHEYRAIADAGIVLQLDSPDLCLSWGCAEYGNQTYADYRKLVSMHVSAINHALSGIPAEQVRLHLCWGNAERPHVHDVPIAEIIDVVYQLNVGALLFEGANPRHNHEWKIFRDHPLPAEKLIIPGVIDTLTNFVEHPELVAERIVRYADIVGRENVLAGTDCGFSTRVNTRLRVHPTVTWAKLQSLSEGAKLASKILWK
jgi:5-methyltetrahydropteroyltriglutamate--homocysteine methyltransferase